MVKQNYIKSFLMLILVFGTSIVFAATAPVTVNTYDSDGNPIAAKFKIFKGPNYVGEFDAGTSVDLDVGGTYKLFAHYVNTSTGRETFTVEAAGHTFNYSTTNVSFDWGGDYLNYRGSGSWKSFGKTDGEWNSKELFPNDFYGNTMQIMFAYKWNDRREVIIEMAYAGQTSISKVVSQLQLLDHNGDPLEGGTARGGYATPTVWHVNGSTDANGFLLDMRDGTNTNLSYEMKFNNTIEQSVQQTGSFYTFQTQLITMRLETCEGAPLEGGHVRWGHGTSYGTYHFAGGNTDANGESYLEFFPGTYSFEMGLNSTTNAKSEWIFPGDGATVSWQTTNVTLNYAGSISYGGPTGDRTWFTKPSMEMMPGGTYMFHFRGAGTTELTLLSGCASTRMVKAVAMIRLEDSNGDGLEGGVATYYNKGWKTAGITNENGNIFTIIDGTATKYSFRMKWAGYSQKLSNVDITTTVPVLFQTIPVVARLENSEGAGLADGEATYYASGWKTLGTTDETGNTPGLELLPGKYSFRMKYLGFSQKQSNVNISETNPVVFATKPMVVELRNSANELMDEGVVTYYASGWKTFGTTSGGTVTKELLPGKYSFRMKFEGYSQKQSNIDISTSNPLAFHTVAMEAQLQNSANELMDEGVVTYYASGWKTFGTTSGGTVTKELLPGKYSFRMKFEGYSQKQSNIDVAVINPLIFQTTAMVVSLQTSEAIGLPGGDVTYYASGWKTFGTTDESGDATKELLPGKYSFRMKYIGQSNKKSNIDIALINPLVFNTVKVDLNYNGTIQYYASGWKEFTQPSMEMLPYNYSFRFDGNRTKINVSGTSIDESYVLLTLLDENNKGVPGGKAKPAYGGSWGAVLEGETNAQGKLFSAIPSGYTKIKMTVNQGSEQQMLADLETSNYTWDTQILRIWLNDHDGSAITDQQATLSQGGGYWYDWGNLKSAGYLDIPLFARSGAYKFRMNYNFTSKEMLPVVGENTGIDNFYFQTGQVFGDCISSYSAGSWHTFTDGMELMPGTRDFKSPIQPGTVIAGEITYLDCDAKSASAGFAGDYETSLNNVYPNPFSNSVNVAFSLEKEQKVIVVVYDMKGALVKTLVNRDLPAGEHKLNWDTKNENGGTLNEGVYIVKIVTANAVDQKTIIKMR